MSFRKDPPLPPHLQKRGQPCPWLGFENDKEVRYSYPESGNYCHRVKPPQSVALIHQEGVCLSGDFLLCPVNADSWRGPLPPELRSQAPSGVHLYRKNRFVLIIVSLIILLIALVIYLYSKNPSTLFFLLIPPTPTFSTFISPSLQFPSGTSQSKLSDPQSSIPNPSTPHSTINTQKSAIPSPTFTHPTPTSIPKSQTPYSPLTQSTVSNQQSATPTLHSTISKLQSTITHTPGPLEETPFGPAARYLVYMVKTGDLMETIADRFDTSVEVLQAANQSPHFPLLWGGWPAVIPVGETDPANIFPLRAIWMDEPTRLADLVVAYDTPESDLRTLNSLGPGQWVESLRWIIVPRK